jgi:hypothetical protein
MVYFLESCSIDRYTEPALYALKSNVSFPGYQKISRREDACVANGADDQAKRLSITSERGMLGQNKPHNRFI